MYRVLIVDDDFTVREDLRTIIDWSEKGFELLEDAINGKEALSKITVWNPDIIIVDLGMPVMDGIEMLRQLKQMKFRGKTIVLTCHDEFSSVRDAMKLGASDYLLKHMISAEELLGVLFKNVQELEEKRLEDNEIRLLKQIKNSSVVEMKKIFLERFIKGYYKTTEAVEKQIEELGLDIKPGNFVLCTIYIDNYFKAAKGTDAFDSLSLEAYVNVEIGKVLQTHAGTINAVVENDRICLLFSFEPCKGFFVISNDVYSAVSRILTHISAHTGISLTIGISGVCSIPQDIPHFYRQSKLAAEGRFYLGRGKIIHFSEVEKNNLPFNKDFKELESEIRNAVILQPEMVGTVIKNICSGLEKSRVSVEGARDILVGVVSVLKKLQVEFSIQADDVFGNLKSVYNHVFVLETLEDIRIWLDEKSKALSGLLKARYSESLNRNEITKAKEYIESNYSKEITLDEVSSRVNLSRTYFSQLFKKETGKNFVEYLAEFRMEKAKRIISETNLKIVDVGCMVGISNYRYFTTLFKRSTGLTPVEFRNLHNSGKHT